MIGWCRENGGERKKSKVLSTIGSGCTEGAARAGSLWEEEGRWRLADNGAHDAF